MKNSKQILNNHLPIVDYYDKNVCPEKNKNRQMKYILCLLVGLCSLTSITARPITLTAKYKIYMLGANIGEFSVTQTNNHGNVNIDATTEVKIKFLFAYRIKYMQNTIYNHGVLQNAHVKTYKNGKLNSTMKMTLQEGAYQLIIDGDTTTISDSVTYSGSLIYFNEPKAATRIFKERNAEMRQISPEDTHTYVIKNEKGKLLNRYSYEMKLFKHLKKIEL
jgi:hypothetical protein